MPKNKYLLFDSDSVEGQYQACNKISIVFAENEEKAINIFTTMHNTPDYDSAWIECYLLSDIKINKSLYHNG
jgi:hypothetical protein